MKCAICQSVTNPCFTTLVLGKYTVQYYQCSHCEFIQTEFPYWLDEAYSSAITRLDIGLVGRNERTVGTTQAVIQTWFNPQGKFIDYGGGYGLMVRMMRDRGFDYYRYDTHCANLFAEQFDIADVPTFKAELLTAYEVMEHLPDPVAEMETMLSMSDTILLSTMVQPTPNVTPENWWYFIPYTGQHVSLFSRRSMQMLADRFNLNYCWNKQNDHLFSRKPIPDRMFKLVTHPRLTGTINRFRQHPPSRLQTDFNQIAAQVPQQLKQ